MLFGGKNLKSDCSMGNCYSSSNDISGLEDFSAPPKRKAVDFEIIPVNAEDLHDEIAIESKVETIPVSTLDDLHNEIARESFNKESGSYLNRKVDILHTSSSENIDLLSSDIKSDYNRSSKKPKLSSSSFDETTTSQSMAPSSPKSVKAITLSSRFPTEPGSPKTKFSSWSDPSTTIDDVLLKMEEQLHELEKLDRKKLDYQELQCARKEELEEFTSSFTVVRAIVDIVEGAKINTVQSRFPTRHEKLKLETMYSDIRMCNRLLAEVNNEIQDAEKYMAKLRRALVNKVHYVYSPETSKTSPGIHESKDIKQAAMRLVITPIIKSHKIHITNEIEWFTKMMEDFIILIKLLKDFRSTQSEEERRKPEGKLVKKALLWFTKHLIDIEQALQSAQLQLSSIKDPDIKGLGPRMENDPFSQNIIETEGHRCSVVSSVSQADIIGKLPTIAEASMHVVDLLTDIEQQYEHRKCLFELVCEQLEEMTCKVVDLAKAFVNTQTYSMEMKSLQSVISQLSACAKCTFEKEIQLQISQRNLYRLVVFWSL